MRAEHTSESELTLDERVGTSQFLTFLLAGEEYGVEILRVQEIKGWNRATPVPNAPDYVRGVINLRGTIVPVVDLRVRFGLEELAYGPTTVVIVVRVRCARGERTVGLVVDAVSEVYHVPAEEMKPAPDMGGAIDTDFLKGLATVGEKMVVLLDVDALINVGVLEEVAERAH